MSLQISQRMTNPKDSKKRLGFLIGVVVLIIVIGAFFVMHWIRKNDSSSAPDVRIAFSELQNEFAKLKAQGVREEDLLDFIDEQGRANSTKPEVFFKARGYSDAQISAIASSFERTQLLGQVSDGALANEVSAQLKRCRVDRLESFIKEGHHSPDCIAEVVTLFQSSFLDRLRSNAAEKSPAEVSDESVSRITSLCRLDDDQARELALKLSCADKF